MEWTNLNVGFLVVVILGLEKVVVWIWKNFNNAYKLKKKNDDLFEMVEKHDVEIRDINSKMDTMMEMIDKLFDMNKIQTRHSIVSSCTDALEREYIEQHRLQSLEDMFSMYTEVLHGNSYVGTLMAKVRLLPIKGKVGDDIDKR